MKTQSAGKQPLSEKNTKQEIMQAYHELLQKTESGPITADVVEKIGKVNKGVRTNLSTLVATVEQTLTGAIGDLTSQLENATDALEELRKAADTQRVRITQERDEEQKRRARDEEEYFYTFKKQKARQEEELFESKRRVEADIAARKEEIKAQQEELTELRGQVKTFEARMAKSVNEAVAQTTKDLTTQFAHKEALSAAESNGIQNLLKQQVAALSATVAGQKQEIERLNKAIVDASAQVTRIAERAVSRTDSTPTLATAQTK